MTVHDTPWPTGAPCWVDMAVPDVRGAQRFYRSLLGWEIVDTGARMGHYLLCTVGGRNVAALFRPMPGIDPLPWTVYLAAGDAGAALERVTERGGRTVTEPLHIPGVGVMALATDPCGALFGIWAQSGMIGFGITGEPGAIGSCDLRVADPEVAREFYAAVFGWTFVPGDGDGEGDAHTALVDGRAVATVGPAQDGAARWLVTFAVADPGAALDQVTAGGGRIVEARDGLCADPAGILFAVGSTR